MRDEQFSADGEAIYSREFAQVNLVKTTQDKEARFSIDWHLVALPIIQESAQDPLRVFKLWLSRMLILQPIPSLIEGESSTKTREPNVNGTDFGAWFSGLLADLPSSYIGIYRFLKELMPDLHEITNETVGTESRTLEIRFSEGSASIDIPFKDLSDGEKCFMICALVVAANQAGPVLCFWDEPDNYLALKEVGHFGLALRKAFQARGQLITTSQNPEAIRSFTSENTLYLQRRNHLEPTRIRLLQDLPIDGDLIRGDLDDWERLARIKSNVPEDLESRVFVLAS